MSSDKSSIIEKAQKLAAKGQIDKAIEEWQKLIAETPNDGNIYNTIGDLHLKANHTQEAIAAYLKAANAFRGAGFELKSIAVYKKIVKIDPSRMDVYEKLADVHAERGLAANAIEDYLRVAKHHAKEGNMQASIAVYRKLANLDPKNFAVRQKLAEICQKWGLAKEAVEEYGKVLSIFKDRQMTSEAQQVIDQVMKLDPEIAEKQLSGAAESSSPASEAPPTEKELSQPPPEAVEKSIPPQIEPTALEQSRPPAEKSLPEAPLSLSAKMEKSLQEGDWLAAEVLMEELRDQPAEAFSFLSKWVDYFLQRGSSPKAFLILQKTLPLAESEELRLKSQSLIQAYLAENPEQVSAHQLLAENFERSGNEREAIQCYSKIISLLDQQRSEKEAKAYYEKIKTRLPGISAEPQWRARFEPETIAEPSAVIEALPPEPIQEISAAEQVAAPEVEEILSNPEPISEVPSEPIEILQNEETSIPEPISEEKESSQAPVEAPALQEVSEATFQGHLTEAEVYIKYGLNSKAIEQLTLLSELAPSREEPHIQLKELYIKEGLQEKAADECLLLAKIYERIGAEDKRSAILEEMRSLAPNRESPALEEINDRSPVSAAADPGVEELHAPEGQEEIPIGADEEVAALPMEEDLSIPSEDERVSASEEEIPAAEDLQGELAQAQEYINNGNKEAAKALLWKILKIDSGCAEARMMLLNLQSAAKKEEKLKESSADPSGHVEPTAEGEEFSFEGLSQEIEQGLDDLLSDDSQESSSQEGSAAEEVSLPETGEGKEDYVDLKSIFGEELNLEADSSFDFEVPGLDDALNDLKETSHRAINEQEFETHYNLGIAYKEMGLIPEAIKEFQLAFQGNHRFQDASSMLASCYQENGMIDTAIEILQNALEDARCTKENTLALKYELAMLYDLQGNQDQAKALYNEIYELDPNFRDIAVKKSEKAEGLHVGENQTVPPIPESSKPNRGPEPKKKNRISYL